MLTLVKKALTRRPRHHPAPDDLDDLPGSPDEIDLERIVSDPAYRAAVKTLLRKWHRTGQGENLGG